jgi:hypothetical protein
MFRKSVIATFFLALAMFNLSVWAQEISPLITLSGVRVNPSSWGAELGAAGLFQPFSGRNLSMGPRLGWMWASGDSQTRYDLQFGGEGILWFVNAIGTGLELSLIAPSWVTTDTGSFNNSVHFRINPTLSVRLARFQKSGAFGVRFGLPYDTLYQWGFQLGVTCQTSGVSHIGEFTE